MTTAATPRAVPATVRVVLFALDGTVTISAVTDTLATWQHLVAGSIEFVRLISPLAGAPRDELLAIINEEGLYLQPPSPWVWPLGARAEVGTPIHGPFVVARWTYEPNGDDHAVERSARSSRHPPCQSRCGPVSAVRLPGGRPHDDPPSVRVAAATAP